MTDAELLAAYVNNHDQDAFRILIERHAGLVYAAALRQVRDPGLAQDVLQGVFMALAAKAPGLQNKAATIPGWLLIAARYGARNLLRSRAAHIHHEQEAATMKTASTFSADSEKLFSILDQAMSRLSMLDRTAVALYYFENQSMREIGNALAVSEGAAQIRVTRALSRLRAILAHAGIACPADAFEESLHRNGAVAPPAAVLTAVTNNILHPATSASGGSAVAQGILKSLLIKKAATAVIAAALFVTAAAPTASLLYHSFSSSLSAAPSALPLAGVSQIITSAPPAVSVPADSSFTVTLSNGISIELLGLMDNSTKQSWAPDGSPLKNPLRTVGDIYVYPNADERGIKWSALLHLPPKLDVECQSNLNGGNGGSGVQEGDQNESTITELSSVPQSKITGTIRFDLATGAWAVVMASDGTKAVDGSMNGIGNFTLQPAVNDKNNLSVTVIQKNDHPNFYLDYTYQLVARTNNGKLIYPNSTTSNNNQLIFSFDNMSLDRIQRISFLIRRWNLFVEFQNVSLYPGRHTNVQIDSNADIWQNIN